MILSLRAPGRSTYYEGKKMRGPEGQPRNAQRNSNFSHISLAFKVKLVHNEFSLRVSWFESPYLRSSNSFLRDLVIVPSESREIVEIMVWRKKEKD